MCKVSPVGLGFSLNIDFASTPPKKNHSQKLTRQLVIYIQSKEGTTNKNKTKKPKTTKTNDR